MVFQNWKYNTSMEIQSKMDCIVTLVLLLGFQQFKINM